MKQCSTSVLLVIFVWLAGMGAAAAAPLGARQVLANEAFGFCHDERYPLTVEEAQWCPLLPPRDPPCPTFQAACGAPRAAKGSGGPQWRRSAEEGEEHERTRGPDDFHRDRESEEPNASLPPEDAGVGVFAHVLVWVIVAGMLAAVLVQLRGPSARRPREPSDEPEPSESEPGDFPAALAPSETDVERLLARAVTRAERGELDAAVADGHAALVRGLSERGHIRLHASRTNGDHVRDLRDAPTLYEPTRQAMRIVERVQFGHAAITRADVDHLIARVREVLGTLAGVLLLLWTTLACTADEPHRYPWSHSPSGTAGVIELLHGHGLELEYRRTTLDHPNGIQGITPIVLDGSHMSDEEWSALMAHVRRGGNAVLATREPLPLELGVGRVTREGHALVRWGGASEGGRPAVPGDAGLSSAGPEGIPVYVDARGTPYALRRSLGQGTVLVLADDRLLRNGALAVPDNDVALVALLREFGPRLELIDGGVRSFGLSAEGGASDPFHAISRAHLTPVILQLLLFVLLLYLWRGVHFGRPRDPGPPSRRRFVEHVDALAQHYHRAGARGHALRLYAGWALERIAERFGGRRRGLQSLASRIAARTGRDETEIMRTLAEAHHARDARDDHDAHGSEDDLRVLRELGQLIDTTRANPPRTQGPTG